jgi:protein gp37
MQKTGIEWTDFTANPIKYRDAAGNIVWGCVKTSPGCTHCYAEALANRYGRGGPFKQSVMDGLTPFLDEKELHKMLTYKPASGARCFIGDMTDIFGEWVPDEMLDRLFAVLAMRKDVTWQVLTKRAERMRDYMLAVQNDDKDLQRFAGHACNVAESPCAAGMFDKTDWPFRNVWLGVSVEDQKRADERIRLLLETPAAVRFLSCEPLLSPISFVDGPLHPEESTMGEWCVLDLGIKWVIVGGESGPGSRPMQVEWARSIVQQCKAAGVPAFVKQLGSTPHYCSGSWGPHTFKEESADGGYSISRLKLVDRKGGDPEEWPKDLRVRQFPALATASA